MSQDQLIQAVADQDNTLATKLGRSPQAVLDDMYRYLLTQNLRSFIAANRAEAEARGYTPADVEQWIEEARQERRVR